MAQEASNKITLKTSEGVLFEVELSIAKKMQFLKTTIDTNLATIPASVIQIPEVSSRDLARIIEYYRKHKARVGKDFDNDFVKALSNKELKDLMMAAHHLDVKEMANFLDQCVADRLQNKSVEFVRSFFGVVSDYTPEEEAKLHEENSWAFNGVDDDEN